MLYLGADHRGYELKEKIKKYLTDLGYQFEDLGAHKLDPQDDYPDFASAVSQRVAENPQESRGILICGSGVGVDVVANKFRGIRSALVFEEKQAQMSRAHDNTNVLSIAADFLSEEKAQRIVKIWLKTKFSKEERHQRRLEEISKIETNPLNPKP